MWKETPGGNEILQHEKGDYFISYRGDTSAPLGISFFAGDNHSDETALVLITPIGHQYMILNGDFRKQYEEVFDQGYNACKAIFDTHKAEHKSSWSDDS